MRDNSDNVIMWTSKEDIVIETLEREGVSFVKKEYIKNMVKQPGYLRLLIAFSVKKRKKEFLSRSRQKVRFGYLRMKRRYLRVRETLC